MTDVPAAFAFLITRSVRNRIMKQAGRVRNPRYALAIVFGLAYIWFAFLRQPMPQGRAEVTHTINTAMESVLAIGLALTTLLYWVGIGVNGALAFQPAEVGLLFPAPVSRHALIAYKVVRTQLILLVSCMIWAVLIRRWGVTLPAPMRFATAWGVLSILSLHRLGAALMQVPTPRGTRWIVWLPRLLAALAIAALVLGVGRALAGFSHLEFAQAMRGIATALAAPPAAWALAPFRIVLAPLYASTPAAWAGSFAIVAAIVAAHAVWVVAMNVPFEEVAATASAALARRRAAFRERRTGGAAVVKKGKVKRGWLPLAPLGNPAVAITWKNTVALSRTGTMRSLIFIVALLIVTTRFMAGLSGEHVTDFAAAAPIAAFAVMLFALGPRMLRNDLRQDLPKLALLKSYPLTGTALVASEIASPTLVLGILQCALIAVGFVMLPAGTVTKHGAAVAVLLLLSPLVLIALNAANVTVQNGIALLFPAWVRLGTDSGGVEVIGQNLLVVFGSIFALVLALIPPVAAGGIVVLGAEFALGTANPPVAVAIGAVTALVVLTIEVALLVRMLGGVFERMDLSALG
ncbi:MAG: putative ABC exporter domain-containing protein [Gemmatimonadales bacterium]